MQRKKIINILLRSNGLMLCCIVENCKKKIEFERAAERESKKRDSLLFVEKM